MSEEMWHFMRGLGALIAPAVTSVSVVKTNVEEARNG